MQTAVIWIVLGVVIVAAVVSVCVAPNRMQGGVWAWGIATAALGVAVVFVVVFGWPPDVYTRVKDSATAIGAVVAASALAWSLFFQVGNTDSQKERDKIIDEIRVDVRQIKEKITP
jgi:hypothetical protein